MARISAVVKSEIKEWLFYEIADAQKKWLDGGREGLKPTESKLIADILEKAAKKKINRETR